MAILYPENGEQIIIHDEKYPVEQTRPAPLPADTERVQPAHSQPVQQQPVYHQNTRPGITDPRPLRGQPVNSVYPSQFENFDRLFEPVFIPNPDLLPFPADANWNIQMWESLEITVQ